ncbi:MAG: DUF4372 domain-containing protein [Akkermansia sp.]|nr:DUF4372 domain-containing protein [Akkermansia sp.]
MEGYFSHQQIVYWCCFKKTPSMSTVHLFSQVASLIDRTIVVSAAKKRHTDKYCPTLDTWTHLIALLFCHMADCQSLRDICKGLQGIRGGLNHL